MDLNPEYNKQRHQRAVRLANTWLKTIKENLNEKVEVERRKLFN